MYILKIIDCASDNIKSSKDPQTPQGWYPEACLRGTIVALASPPDLGSPLPNRIWNAIPSEKNVKRVGK